MQLISLITIVADPGPTRTQEKAAPVLNGGT